MSVWDNLDEATLSRIREQWPNVKPPPAPPTVHPKLDHNVRVGGKNDMTITIHALERMAARWPELVEGRDDDEVARLIQGEINDAMVKHRYGTVCPLELANKNVGRWKAQGKVWYCWLQSKKRGYVCREDPKEGLVVMTTLVGKSIEESRGKLVQRSHGVGKKR